MGNPAEHEARADAERSGEVVGSDVDRIESALLGELVRLRPDDEPTVELKPKRRPIEHIDLWGVDSV